ERRGHGTTRERPRSRRRGRSGCATSAHGARCGACSARSESVTADRAPSVPQGLTEEQFARLSIRVRRAAGYLGRDIRVQGSRAAWNARPDSDLDIAIRVSDSEFESILQVAFGAP